MFIRLLMLTLFFVVQSCPSSKSEPLQIDIPKKQSRNLVSMTSPETGLRFGFLQNYYSNGRIEPKDCSTVANETVSLVQVDSTRNDDCVIWEFVAIDSEYFRIINNETGQFFRPLRCGNVDSDQLEVKQVSTSNTGTCTQWKLTDIGDGRYRIVNRVTGNFIRAKGCSVIKDGRIPIVQIGEQFTGPCTLWRLIPVEGAPSYEYTPGLTDASKLQPSDPITVTEDNTVIENLHFTASASLSHIEIADNVKGTVIRNCKFENASVGNRQWNDGGAIRLNPGSTAVVINSEFENNFRAVRAFQSSGMQLMFSKVSGIMRNAVVLNGSNNDSFQNVVAYNVIEWKQEYFRAKDRNGERSWIDRGGDIGWTDWFPEDGISVYNTNGTSEKPTLILGIFFVQPTYNGTLRALLALLPLQVMDPLAAPVTTLKFVLISAGILP